MSLLIEDSPRNLLAWIQQAIRAGTCAGAVINPFASPWISKQHRRSAGEMAERLHSLGAETWFDATTHALQMPGVGDFRYYNEYSLWSGNAGDLSTPALMSDHIKRVYAVQDEISATHLAPTTLLHYAESETSLTALEFAEEALTIDPGTWLSIAGTASFWASGAALDAHIAALAQLMPQGWFITTARPLSVLPAEAQKDEIEGICRSVRALSEYAPIHVAYGDLAGLPAVAAGATSIGTGWDQRQRICGFGSFAGRDPDADGGGWYKRPILRALLGHLKVGEAAFLNNRDPARVRRLGSLPPSGPREAFFHYIAVLNAVVDSIASQPDYWHRYALLVELYEAAIIEWPVVQRITSARLGADEWCTQLLDGLRAYGSGEGW